MDNIKGMYGLLISCRLMASLSSLTTLMIRIISTKESQHNSNPDLSPLPVFEIEK